MTLDRGAELFVRFALPPNSLGYCGPGDTAELIEAAAAHDMTTVRALSDTFQGATPYLQLIAASANTRDPLAYDVVSAYWMAGPLLDAIDPTTFGQSIVDRFAARSGTNRRSLTHMIADGRPSHAFHVFCVYPWVGMLRAGYVVEPLHVLDECRISWGRVSERGDGWCRVDSRPLHYDEPNLRLGPPESKCVVVPAGLDGVRVGDLVAVHWSTVSARLSPGAVDDLETDTTRHLQIVNDEARGLAAVIERAV